MYKSELADKAQREYEDWIARKAEREGGIGEGYGTEEWVPRERQQARYGLSLEPTQAYTSSSYDQTGYPYWDPTYWWAMAQMQMMSLGDGLPLSSEESGQGSSDDGTP